jgi:hypothetical protein
LKKALVAVALVAVLAAVAACGSSSSTSGTGGGGPTSADRDKFVGTWNGNYGCPGIGDNVGDAMVIRAGSGDLGLSIQIHVGFANPDTLTGTLTSRTEVNIPEQSMGGEMGTAKLTLSGDKMEFSVTGMGMTCGGSDYARMP